MLLSHLLLGCFHSLSSLRYRFLLHNPLRWWLPFLHWLRQWWYRRAEEHYLICAAVEHSRAREAEENEAYYQKRAAMARSARCWD